MNGFTFGCYYPGDSVIHRLDPRVKLGLGFAFLLLSLLVSDPRGLVVIAVGLGACFVMSQVPWRRILRSTIPLLGFVALVALLRLATERGGEPLWEAGPFAITQNGLYQCVFTAARLTLMMAGMSLITLTTTTLDLTAGFERLMAPLARFGVPVHELGMMLGLALRFMPQLSQEMHDTYVAQVSRGARLARGPWGGLRLLSSVTVPLFASVFRHAESLSEAMESRCYHGERGRTRLHPLRLGRIDAGAIVLFAAWSLLLQF